MFYSNREQFARYRFNELVLGKNVATQKLVELVSKVSLRYKY